MKTYLLILLITSLLMLVLPALGHAWPIASATIQHLDSKNFGQRWSQVFSNEDANIKLLMQTLSRSKTGTTLLKLASKKANTHTNDLLEHMIKSGAHSASDATIIRKTRNNTSSSASANSDQLKIDYRYSITIDREASIYTATLDLAHELTHFVFRQELNPYSKDFTLKNFITSIIEGPGGEASAYYIECKVWHELFRSQYPNKYLCEELTFSGNSSLKVVASEFYSLGDYYDDFMALISKFGLRPSDFPLIDRHTSPFISAVSDIPYPLAAAKDFIRLWKKSCQNDLKMQISTRGSAQLPQEHFDRCKDLLLGI
ncbi:MAG: hypothetical protein HQK50_05925 [Oligoflexia bacterium]|nr:hypothetical protein [Oligoflexia bacterium]MBF0365088.1 hypothetical protein [Oligoflexia bacterium]